MVEITQSEYDTFVAEALELHRAKSILSNMPYIPLVCSRNGWRDYREVPLDQLLDALVLCIRQEEAENSNERARFSRQKEDIAAMRRIFKGGTE